MKHALHCKFCKKPIIVEVDDSYSELGDPMKLLPMASCDRCADLRIKRRQIEGKIKAAVMVIIQAQGKVSSESRAMIAEALRVQTQAYSRLIAEWHNMSGMAWDENIPEAIMEKPDKWANILGRLWKIFREEIMPESIARAKQNQYPT